MFTVRIMNEFLHGPVWVLDEEGVSAAEGSLPLVENDSVVQEFNKEAGELYDSYYEFDSHGEACSFNEDKQAAEAGRMLALVAKLRARLDEINDGSFSVEDLETPFSPQPVGNINPEGLWPRVQMTHGPLHASCGGPCPEKYLYMGPHDAVRAGLMTIYRNLRFYACRP